MMSRGQLLEDLARRAYRSGADPIDFTTDIAAFLIEETFDLDEHDPAAAQLARRILGYLLEVGWVMPEPRP